MSLTLCGPVDCSPPGSSVHRISEAKIQEGVAISFFRGPFQSRDRTQISCLSGIGKRILYHWATGEALNTRKQRLMKSQEWLAVMLGSSRAATQKRSYFKSQELQESLGSACRGCLRNGQQLHRQHGNPCSPGKLAGEGKAGSGCAVWPSGGMFSLCIQTTRRSSEVKDRCESHGPENMTFLRETVERKKKQ